MGVVAQHRCEEVLSGLRTRHLSASVDRDAGSEFAAVWRAEAKQVPRGRAWYLHRFAVTDLSIRMAPFG
jgi:hypothetical protein